MTKKKFIIGWLYSDLMDTYGDRGNIIALKNRLIWRGFETQVEEITVGDKWNDQIDFLFMGGAQDKAQQLLMADLTKKTGHLKEYMDSGGVGLFVCAAYQLLGKYYQPSAGEPIAGLGIFDLYTIHPGLDKDRLIGNVIIETDFLSPKTLVGFENHGGRTILSTKCTPLGTVSRGFGNNDRDKTEGIISNNFFGTYLHGPILPRNPHFADHLIKLALNKRDCGVELSPIDDEIAWKAHEQAL